MTHGQKVTSLVFLSIGIVMLMIHLFLPGGLPNALDRLTKSDATKKPAPAAPVAKEPDAAAARATDWIKDADKAYDRGDFVRAIDSYLAARADADSDYRDRGARGLPKAVLAWALTVDVPPPDPMPADPDAEIALRQKATEDAPSERAWYDLLTYAAGCGARAKLWYLSERAVGSALHQGPVEKRLRAVLEIAGPRAVPLRDAMRANGFLDTEPVDPYETAAKPKPAPSNAPAKTRIEVPSGKFSDATKKKLAEAVELETKGTAEYAMTGPDNPARKQHRRPALDLLKKARDIYDAASEEDPNSLMLRDRLQEVRKLILDLQKEMSLGE
jgi:hypothetical protein